MQFKFFSKVIFAINFLPLCLLPASRASAAQIVKANGKSVLVKFDPAAEQLAVGEKYFAISDGKKKAIVEITQVKGGQALAKIVKGSAEADETLKLASKAGQSDTQKAFDEAAANTENRIKKHQSRRSRGESPWSGLSLGVLVGAGLDSQAVKVAPAAGTSETVSLSGTGFGLKGFVDLPLMEQFGLFGRFGVEKFSATGKSSSKSEKVDFTFLTVDGLIHFDLLTGSLVPYLMAGFSMEYPLSQSTGGLLKETASLSSLALAGGGLNIRLSDTMYATVQGEYGYFLMQTEVTTSIIAVRGGIGTQF